MAFDYDAAKAEFGVARARELEQESRGSLSAQTDAPQATSQPQQSEAPAKKAGVGGGGWNEDFDEAWGRRVLENPKLKDLFGLSDYSSLRDEETRRQINRWLRNNKGGEGGDAGTGVAQSATSAAATVGAGKKAETGATVQPAGTTGKASLPGGVKPPPAVPPQRSTSLLAPGRLPSSPMWKNTILPASGGEIPQLNSPWWPSYPPGNAPPATKPGTASMQAAALGEQRG